jgi:putative transposase
MPWEEHSVLDQRVQFIGLYLQDVLSFSDLCRSFGISRTTGYKFVDRYNQYGLAGLEDQPKAPYSHPNATDEQTQFQIVRLRTQHPSWGPKKLRTVLTRDFPGGRWPAQSTIGDMLKAKGLVPTRRRNLSTCATASYDLSNPNAPNAVWTADFKGQFKLQNNQTCYPLTICDRCSRMILKCQALPSTATDPAKAVWVATFREYGLPAVIRSDNGAPFASVGLGGISRLSAWWIRLGVFPERIQPGKPQQNGSHERMHKTLKQEVAARPQANPKLQQQAFDDFVYEYNNIRPHEALAQRVPASLYCASPRQYPLILPQIEYADGMLTRHVRTTGCIRWKGDLIFVSETLAGEYVGLERLDDRRLALYYGPVPLAVLDDHTNRFLSAKHSAATLKQLRKEAQDQLANC